MEATESAFDAMQMVLKNQTERKFPFYDAETNQRIPLTVEKDNKSYDVQIELTAISDDDYFLLTDSLSETAKRIKTVSVELFEPFADLGRRKAVARFGYKTENPNFKSLDSMEPDFIAATKSYLSCSESKDVVETSDLLDDGDEFTINLLSNFNGTECPTKIFFRRETKTEMDEYFAALAGQPMKNALASAKKLSKEKRLFALYEAMKTGDEGYSNRVPAWHGIEAVSAHLNGQLARLGKL